MFCSFFWNNVLYLHEIRSLHSVSQGRLLHLFIPKHPRDKDVSKKLLYKLFSVVNALCTAVGILLLSEWRIHSFAEGCNFIPLCRGKIVIEPWRICVVIQNEVGKTTGTCKRTRLNSFFFLYLLHSASSNCYLNQNIFWYCWEIH